MRKKVNLPERIGVRLSNDVAESVRKLASVLELTVSDVVRCALPEPEFFDMSAELGTLPPIPLLLDGGLRAYMANDADYPVIAEQLGLDKTALLAVRSAWMRAQAGTEGDSVEKVTEGGGNIFLGYRVIYPAQLRFPKVKQV